MLADFTLDNNGSQDEGAEALFSLISEIEKGKALC
jgi:hypothetical protein